MTPAFDPTRQNQTAYTAAVGYTIKQITVEASATDENAEVTFRGRHADDANDGVDGHQVDLVVGENVINVRVARRTGPSPRPTRSRSPAPRRTCRSRRRRATRRRRTPRR